MNPNGQSTDSTTSEPPGPIDRVFGAENRARLLTRYFAAREAVTPADAWHHVYHLLLWIDRTTALAHCYESDKAQPGRAWYERSLAFHDWMSRALGVEPAGLGEVIDWLFREAISDLTSQAVASRGAVYERQRAPYAGRDFPEPGEDPELACIIREMLAPWLERRPPDDELRRLTRRIHAHLNQENKRRNLRGLCAAGVRRSGLCIHPDHERVRRRAAEGGLRAAPTECPIVHPCRPHQPPGGARRLRRLGTRGGEGARRPFGFRSPHGPRHLARAPHRRLSSGATPSSPDPVGYGLSDTLRETWNPCSP